MSEQGVAIFEVRQVVQSRAVRKRWRRSTAAPLATRGPCCSPASMKCYRSAAPSVGAKCAASPSSPRRRWGATSSFTSASRWLHPPSPRPAARHYGLRPMRSRIRQPIRRSNPPRPTRSISASPGSQVGARCGLVTGPAGADRQGARGDPPQPARNSLLPARCRRKPTVDPHDRHPPYSASRDRNDYPSADAKGRAMARANRGAF